MRSGFLAGCLLLSGFSSPEFLVAAEATFLSHSPTRPLPVASSRPMSKGRGLYVDAKNGKDTQTGEKDAPWRTLGHAVKQLKPGDVLYLKSGVYYEHVVINAQGTHEKPITLRSVPGELAVIDGGLREFFESPATAWEPVPEGAAGEFRSVKAYPDLGGSEGATNVLGNFGDSMIPLHGYRFLSDLRNANEYFAKLNAGKTQAGEGVYCGPGVFYDVNTGRIHCRLAHTKQPALGKDNYSGETDPRKLPLVIAGMNAGSPLTLDGAAFLKVQDLVVRGSRMAAVSISNCRNLEFDGVTAYGGSSAFTVRDTGGLRLWNCALRGIAAPWTFRGSLKYRAIEARIFSASGWDPTGQDNHDFELAHSEFTDCVDGVFLGNVRNVRFHHNLLDNISDDGLFLTAGTAYDGTTPGGNVHIYQNLLSRCLTTFAFGVGHGRQKMTPTGRQAGAGVFIYRNVFDFRRPVMYQQPSENETKLPSYGRVAGDHGGPLWEPMTIYHNTILSAEPPFRNYYLAGLGGHLAGGSMRKVFNNLLVQVDGSPGYVLPPVVPPSQEKPSAPAQAKPDGDPLDDLLDRKPTGSQKKTDPAKKAEPAAPLPVDFQADGNLHWSYGAKPTPAIFQRFRNSADLENSKALYPPGWLAQDVVADPLLKTFHADWQALIDLRLQPGSPAVDAGVKLPANWPDPLRDADRGQPDIGACPAGSEAWLVGQHGRLTIFGTPAANPIAKAAPQTFLLEGAQSAKASAASAIKPAVVVQGYPAFDAPLIEFALRKARFPVVSLERTWLPTAEYDQYGVVVVVGDIRRAKIEPYQYPPADLKLLARFLKEGGTLMLMRGNTALFATSEGRAFLDDLTGGGIKPQADQLEILNPKHDWLAHLESKEPREWVNARNAVPIKATKGERILGHSAGLATLYRLPVGKGQLIYVGWEIAASLPHGRKPSTVEQEAAYEEQMQILQNIIDSLAKARR